MSDRAPISTSAPSRRMPTRSHRASTSLRMCEDRKTVWPRWRASLGALAEGLLHERVQAAGGLVQHEQVGPGHEGGDEDDLLAVALGVLADLLGGVEVEALDELVPVGGVDLALHPAQEVERLGAR